MIDIHNKTWTNHFIVAFGVIVGALLIYGLITTLKPVLGITSGSSRSAITSNQTNTTKKVTLGDTITIELSEKDYPKSSLTRIENPTDLLKPIGSTALDNNGNWIVKFQAVKKGMADIIVKSSNNAVSDFRISIVVE